MKKITTNKVDLNIFLILLFIFLWVLFAFSADNADYAIYKAAYENFQNDSSNVLNDKGFYFLVLIFNSLNFNYQGFLISISLIGLILIVSTIKKFSSQPSKVLFLYSIFPFFFDIVQIRNFLMIALVLFATRYLLKFSFKNMVLYIVFVFIAFSFHTVAIIYLVFLLAYITSIRKVFYISIIVSVTGSFLMLGSLSLINTPLIRNLLLEINPRILFYFTDNLQSSTRLLFIIYILSLFILAYIINKIFYKKLSDSKDFFRNNEQIDKINLMTKLCFLSAIFVVFVILDPTLFRLFRNVIIFVYILSTFVTYQTSTLNNAVNFAINICIWGVALLSFINFLLYDPYIFTTVTLPVLKNNLLINAVLDSWLIYVLLFIISFIFLILNILYKKQEKFLRKW